MTIAPFLHASYMPMSCKHYTEHYNMAQNSQRLYVHKQLLSLFLLGSDFLLFVIAKIHKLTARKILHCKVNAIVSGSNNMQMMQ